MAKSKSLISLSSDDLFSESAPSTHPDILEYRRLDQEDLVNKIMEAREEIATLKDSYVPSDARKNTESKEIPALANELHMLRDIVKTIKAMPKEITPNVIPRENAEDKPKEVIPTAPRKAGRPKGR